MKNVKFLIIGAGPTGLGAAYRLKENGIGDYIILERNPWIGGLATSFVDEKGFTWDIGGHVQFSHYSYFDEAMKVAIPSSQWLTHERECWVWMKERFVPYPFQNNIRFLPKDSMWQCFKGLIELAQKGGQQETPKNFKEWILASFGTGVADEFMIPYNYKVWAYPPEEMSYQWIGERVATVNLSRIAENIVYEKMDASWGPNNTFKFPESGGTGAIWNSIGDFIGREKIICPAEVVSINPDTQVATCADGSLYHYDHILSTMPLDVLTTRVEGTDEEIVESASRLKHSSSNIIGIGIEGKPIDSLKTKCWMYFPESSCPFYRMTMFSNYSPNNVPDKNSHYSLMCEISESPAKAVDRTTMIQQTIDGLRSEGLLPAEHKVISTWSYTAEYGYPTPSVDRDEILKQVIPYMDSLKVYSRGRFGGWKYEVSNQDHSFMQGVEWIDFVMKQIPEQTYRADSSIDPNMTLLQQKAEKKAA